MKFSYSGNVTNRDTKMNIFESIKRNTSRLVEGTLTLGGAPALEKLQLWGEPQLWEEPWLWKEPQLWGEPNIWG